jgi:hypothetical protein
MIKGQINLGNDVKSTPYGRRGSDGLVRHTDGKYNLKYSLDRGVGRVHFGHKRTSTERAISF